MLARQSLQQTKRELEKFIKSSFFFKYTSYEWSPEQLQKQSQLITFFIEIFFTLLLLLNRNDVIILEDIYIYVIIFYLLN